MPSQIDFKLGPDELAAAHELLGRLKNRPTALHLRVIAMRDMGAAWSDILRTLREERWRR